MPTMLAKPDSRSCRRFLRFSVRGLIVLVLVMGGWLGWIVRSARIQREAVAGIRKPEASALITGSCHGNSQDGKPWALRLGVDVIGVDFFGHVTKVWYSDRAITILNARLDELRAENLELIEEQRVT